MLKAYDSGQMKRAITAAKKLNTTPTVFKHKKTGTLYVADDARVMQENPDLFDIAWQQSAHERK